MENLEYALAFDLEVPLEHRLELGALARIGSAVERP